MWFRKKRVETDLENPNLDAPGVIAIYGSDTVMPQFQVQRWSRGLGWFDFRHPFTTEEDAKKFAKKEAKSYPGNKYRVVDKRVGK